jgi:hypothetical protein
MDLPSLRAIAVADVGEPELNWMVRHGEDLLVERKADLPKSPGLGAEVASFANTLGGWLLLGVDDDGRVVGWDPGRVDRQSHLGDLLRNEVDPVPPFIAAERELDGRPITIVRVLETADAPVLVRGTGALYVRDSGGKQPVDDHRTLLALAQRGADAERKAWDRLRELPLVYRTLAPPDHPEAATGRPAGLRAIVRASPLTVSPQFAMWPIAGPVGWFRTVAMHVFGLPNEDRLIEEVQPHGRGLSGLYQRVSDDQQSWRLQLVADSGGVVGGLLERPSGGVSLDTLRESWLVPLIDAVIATLAKTEAIGRAACDAWISTPAPQDGQHFEVPRATQLPIHARCAGSLTIPADNAAMHELALQWEREFARYCGIDAWEPGLERS